LMREQVLKSHVIHTDDTTIRMLAAEKCRTARFWVYIGDAEHPYSVYDFTEDRSRDGPTKFLDGFSGYLQADAYGGYDGIYASGKVMEVACFAHCRRYWWEARATDSHRAHEALSYIGRLYALEEQFREAKLVGAALYAARQQHAEPILDAFEHWLDDPAQQRVLPKSPIGKSRTYTRNQWQALRRYTSDGALSIDNNISERTVKIAAIGRKNYLFVGSHTGGQRAAILYSLVATCKACGVEPGAYLTDLFRTLPTVTSPDDIAAFLPDRWLTTHPEHRWHIDQLRQQERKRSRQARIAKRKN
jgi:transposase